MPEPKVHCKFEVDPNYNEDAALVNDIANVRKHLEKELACVDAIADTTLQAIGLFSILDCLAQEQANYPDNFKDAFCQFVLQHQKQCNYLECVEPITLFYHIEDIIEEAELIPGFPPEKVISIEHFGYVDGKKAEELIATETSQKILSYIEKKMGKPYADKKAKEHQLISLLYRMRSKAVHEMSGLGETWNIEKPILPNVPYYRDVGRSYVLDGNWVYDNVIELIIPNVFIRSILVDCINGYLSDCAKNKRFPFSNNNLRRKHLLSWYDK